MKQPRTDLPGVTVVMPVYNVEAYVERSLQSALEQTYPALTILVVDDGSTDRSLEICRRVGRSSPIVEVVSGPNKGVAAARNRGTELARTEYVAYLDGDDLWHPEKIARQVEAMAGRGPEWAACYCLYRRIDEEDAIIRPGPDSKERGAFFAEHLKRNHVGNGSSLLVRRDAAIEIGGFDSAYAARGLGGCEDFDFQLKLLRRYKMELVPEYLVGYRERQDQMSGDRTRMGNAYLAVVEKFAGDRSLSPSARRDALFAARGCAAVNYFLGLDFARFASTGAANLRVDPLASLIRSARFVAWRARDKARRVAAARRIGDNTSAMFQRSDPRHRYPAR